MGTHAWVPSTLLRMSPSTSLSVFAQCLPLCLSGDSIPHGDPDSSPRRPRRRRLSRAAGGACLYTDSDAAQEGATGHEMGMLQNWLLGCTPGSDSSLPLQNGTLPPSCPSQLTLSTYNCLLSSGSQQVTVTASPLCVRGSGRSRHMDPERERTAPSRRRSQRPKGTERGGAHDSKTHSSASSFEPTEPGLAFPL